MGSSKSRLNRTSVGLKPLAHRSPPVGRVSLNRTSVGLKLNRIAALGFSLAEPQSNQRGIETRGGEGLRAGGRRASIEPAWD